MIILSHVKKPVGLTEETKSSLKIDAQIEYNSVFQECLAVGMSEEEAERRAAISSDVLYQIG